MYQQYDNDKGMWSNLLMMMQFETDQIYWSATLHIVTMLINVYS